MPLLIIEDSIGSIEKIGKFNSFAIDSAIVLLPEPGRPDMRIIFKSFTSVVYQKFDSVEQAFVNDVRTFWTYLPYSQQYYIQNFA